MESISVPAHKKRKTTIRSMSEGKLKEISTLFLSDKKNSNLLIDLLSQLNKPSKASTESVKAVKNVFLETLKRRDMTTYAKGFESIDNAEKQYKEWLKNCYGDAWDKIEACLLHGTSACKQQSLHSLFELLSAEVTYPLNERKKVTKCSFPVQKLKKIILPLSLLPELEGEILIKFLEYEQYKDVYTNIWLAVELLLREICKQQPDDKQVWNILMLLHKLPKLPKGPENLLCNEENVVPEERRVKAAVSKVWNCLYPWHYSSKTHQMLLVVLLEQMMPQMENTIFLTDYFMDALNKNECEINMLALQGVFNLVLKHNIEYPNIFGRLYQIFTEESLKAKYKTRLFVLADTFLTSTHLPLALVAAFAKRFSHLLLVADPTSAMVLMTLIINLLIRHRNLAFLYHKPGGQEVVEDPYLMDEKDPLKSKAVESQLYEMKLMQQHFEPRVAKLAATINNDLPAIELELEPLLELNCLKMIGKQIKEAKQKLRKLSDKFDDKPLSSKMREARDKELQMMTSELNDWFVLSMKPSEYSKCLSTTKTNRCIKFIEAQNIFVIE